MVDNNQQKLTTKIIDNNNNLSRENKTSVVKHTLKKIKRRETNYIKVFESNKNINSTKYLAQRAIHFCESFWR